MTNNKPEGFQERRKMPRILIEIFGSIKQGMIGKECYIQNIGRGGAMVFTNEDFAVGDEIQIHFEAGKRKFDKKSTIKGIKQFTEKRKYILKIGKSLDFTTSLSIHFQEPLELSDFEYIKLNA